MILLGPIKTSHLSHHHRLQTCTIHSHLPLTPVISSVDCMNWYLICWEMAKLLVLLISLLSAAFEMETVTVDWPSGYSVDWSLWDESAHYSLTAKHYFSQKEKAVRWDIFGGTNTYILTVKDSETSGLYYYFPTTNDTAANVTNCLFIPLPAIDPGQKILSTLPDLTGFTSSKNLTINGLRAQKWILKQELSEDAFWLQLGDQTKGPIPIKAEVKERSREEHSELGSRNYFMDYENFQAQEPDKSVWSHLGNVKCQLASIGAEEIIMGYMDSILFRAGLFPLINNFSDQKPLQWKIRRSKGLKISDKLWESASPFPYTDEEVQLMARQLPEVFDWRLHGAVTSVKNQGPCGSCWAFSIAGAMEGAYFRKTGFLGDMSEQALVDCGWWTDPRNGGSIGGCFGGDPSSGLDWIKNHGGLPWVSDYGDYKAVNGRCTLNNVEHFGPIKGFVQVKADVDAVKVALYHHGPLSITICAPEGLSSYENGVFKFSDNKCILDHCVLLVGYGSLNGEDYWLIKNSWGESWGLSGYGLISTENNTLRVLDYVIYPELM